MLFYNFKDDYSEGAHLRILEALQRYNEGQTESYGRDQYCLDAIRLIREKIKIPHADIHFVSGGTQANLLVLSAILRPFESVMAAATAHIAVHETGSIESTGHKINLISTTNGKLTPDLIGEVIKEHQDEHRVKPRAVFISQSTESGTLYTKKELTDLSRYCRKRNLVLYLDGARLAVALTAETNDLTLPDVAELVDVFYIGGTKIGALLGEAIVITNPKLQENFRYHMKQKGALLAKGRIFGIQFLELLSDDLFLELGRKANNQAKQLAKGIESTGYSFWTPPVSNQIFPIFPNTLIDHLREKFGFYTWNKFDNTHAVIRLVTSWATPSKAVMEFISELKKWR